MTKVVIDDPLAALLGEAAGAVTLYTSSGRLVGQFVPPPPLLDPSEGYTDSDAEVRQAFEDARANPTEEMSLVEF